MRPTLFWAAVSHSVLLDFAELVMGPFLQLDNLTLAGFRAVPEDEADGKVSGWHRDCLGQGAALRRAGGCHATLHQHSWNELPANATPSVAP